MLKRISNRLLSIVEFLIIYTAGKTFGISIVIRYLRNPNPRITVKLLRAFGALVGDQTTFKGSLIIDNAYGDKNSAGDFSYLKIGNNCYVGDYVYFDLSNKIEFENNVVISAQASFITHADCNRSEYLAKKFPRKCHKLTIENGVWIGFRATILAGVTVGHQSVIGAHALVRKNVEPKVVYAGIPAKKIKNLEESDKN
jgi:acetyltransferase-like isoleucine patch superfamily enzyme